MLTYRYRQIRNDIYLYLDSRYAGFQCFETIEEYLAEYQQTASEKAKLTDWDSIVLYAVLEYGQEDERLLSANFVMLEIPYNDYVEFVQKLMNKTRFLFFRGRKGYYEY